MAKNNYSDELKDPRWQKMRLKIMERDNWKCTYCGADNKSLSVHHKVYISGKKPWEYNADNLITICQECHDLHHKAMDVYNDKNDENKVDFIRQTLGLNDAKKLYEYLVFKNPNNINSTIVLHIPTGMWRGFNLSIEDVISRIEIGKDSRN